MFQNGFQLSVESNLHLLWFCFNKLCDWLQKLAPLFQPIYRINQTNRDLLACVYPRLVSDTYLFASYSECFMTLFGSVMNDQRDSDFSEFGVLD